MSDTYHSRYLRSDSPAHISTLVLLSGMATLAMNVFLPSLPSMATYFETDYAILQLSVAVYLGVNAILQVIVGPISDNLGRRPVILWGIALFLVATLGCIYAPSAAVFLGFRMMQAVIVSALVLSRAVVRDVVSSAKAASMIAYVTMGMAVVPMIGPALGGVLEQSYGWKASFWLMFGLGSLTLVLTYFDLGETKSASGESLLHQFARYPELLTSPRFWGYAMASGLTSGAFFAYLGGAPFVGSEIFGLPPAQLGIYFGTPAVGYFFGNYLSGRFSMRVGLNTMVLGGAFFSALGCLLSLLLFALGYGSVMSFFGLMILVGLGNGITVPNAMAGMLSVRPHLAGTASGLGGAMMIGLGAALSAAAGVVLGDGASAMPLLWLMAGTTCLGVIIAYLVVLRTRHLTR